MKRGSQGKLYISGGKACDKVVFRLVQFEEYIDAAIGHYPINKIRGERL